VAQIALATTTTGCAMTEAQTKLLISALAQDPLAYVPNYDNFKPGVTNILYSGPYWDAREVTLALESFLLGKWLTTGEYTVRFQHNFARHFNVKHTHMVNSGSSANLIMLAATKKRLGWQDGDEVIVSPVGFPTTIAPIIQNGLKPVFIDIEMDTLNFDVNKIEAACTERTRAILVSPVLGNPPNMDLLQWLSNNCGVTLLGDHCDSLGTLWHGAPLSDLYYAWTTSFFPAHHMTTGEGGMVCSNDGDLMMLAQGLTWWGRDCYCVGVANSLPCGTCKMRFSKWLERDGVDVVLDHKFVFTNMGYNLKPLDLQGAIGLAQLEKIDEIAAKRRTTKKTLAAAFKRLSCVRVASTLPNCDPCWFGVPVICKSDDIKAEFVAYLEGNKIQTRSYFAGNILRHPAYKHLGTASDFPNADLALKRVFFIGCPPHYNKAVCDYISYVVERFKF
jgi:CDP-6-deoxy-D-xylo-4-hexulose-3-dehydrase